MVEPVQSRKQPLPLAFPPAVSPRQTMSPVSCMAWPVASQLSGKQTLLHSRRTSQGLPSLAKHRHTQQITSFLNQESQLIHNDSSRRQVACRDPYHQQSQSAFYILKWYTCLRLWQPKDQDRGKSYSFYPFIHWNWTNWASLQLPLKTPMSVLCIIKYEVSLSWQQCVFHLRYLHQAVFMSTSTLQAEPRLLDPGTGNTAQRCVTLLQR